MIQLPFCPQKTDSACCGPCCLKMLADYYECTKPDGKPYTKESLIQLCRTDREYGTQFSDMRRVIKKLGLKMKKPTMLAVSFMQQRFPMLVCVPDRKDKTNDHYILLTGIVGGLIYPEIFYSDPYYGKDTILAPYLQAEIEKAGNWAWEIERA